MHLSILSLALISSAAYAHPGHAGIEHEIAERDAYFKHAPRDLNHCAAKLKQRGIHDQSLKRRMATVQNLREGIKHRKSMRSLVFSSFKPISNIKQDHSNLARLLLPPLLPFPLGLGDRPQEAMVLHRVEPLARISASMAIKCSTQAISPTSP